MEDSNKDNGSFKSENQVIPEVHKLAIRTIAVLLLIVVIGFLFISIENSFYIRSIVVPSFGSLYIFIVALVLLSALLLLLSKLSILLLLIMFVFQFYVVVSGIISKLNAIEVPAIPAFYPPSLFDYIVKYSHILILIVTASLFAYLWKIRKYLK